MARGKIEFDEKEVEEIILLKLKELGGIKKKLSYNNVTEFNKKIANNKEYQRANGELFNLYGYTFWAGNYNGEDYYGKRKIDEIKNSSNVIIAGEEFNTEVQDIITVVNNFYQKPIILSNKLTKLFEKDRAKIKRLETENEKFKSQIESLNKKIESFEKGFATLFYNSYVGTNSLENVMSMSKPRDNVIHNELKSMFSNDESRLKSVLNIGNSTPKPVETENNIISIETTEEKKKKRRSKYADDL